MSLVANRRILLSAAWLAMVLWATSAQAKTPDPARDYLYPSDASGGWILPSSRTESGDSSGKASQMVQYRAFDGQIHLARAHRGRYVDLLLPGSEPEGPYFRPDHVEELLDRLDILYAAYAELLRTEPAGSGPLTIAFVPQTCGTGCALLGRKAIEILSEPSNYERIIEELDAGRLETVLVHEMAHNFDTYAEYLHYLPDHAHAWTDMFEYLAPYRFARDSRNGETPYDSFNSPVRSAWVDYILDDSATWERCVRDQACDSVGLDANSLWAMPYYRIEALYGTQAIVDSFTFLSEYARKHGPPGSDEEKEILRFMSLAMGAGVNLACYANALRWPVPESGWVEMLNALLNDAALCDDVDKDGFSAITGDCDDQDPASNIISPEIAGNGKDDDCDELIDELILYESGSGAQDGDYIAPVQSQLPFEVEGTASGSEDLDSFLFPLTRSGRARITLCADDGFTGWAVALQPDGSSLEANNWFSYVRGTGCSSNTFDYQSFDTGGIAVMPDQSAGSYVLTVSEGSSLPADHSTLVRVVPSAAAGGVTIEFDDQDDMLSDLGADELEFWISGAGVRFTRPYQPRVTIALTPGAWPQLANDGLYQVRLRARRSGLPVIGFSAGHLFRFEKAPSPPQIHSGFSGAWFDPEHDGEGFIVEVLDERRAVVYWFSFHGDGRQRWLIGVGEVEGNRILIDKLMDSSGGRFGAAFDPADVVLQHRGSLSISFRNCSEAVVNYSVDDLGGHQLLTRLTTVEGHTCGARQTLAAEDLSGSWYDPAHNGEGFVLQRLGNGQAVVFWFTYDGAGNQAWLVNTGTITDQRLTFPELLQPVGGRFGRSFDPTTVEHRNWGELELELDCGGGEARYATQMAGYSSGAQKLVPLTRIHGSGCAQ